MGGFRRETACWRACFVRFGKGRAALQAGPGTEEAAARETLTYQSMVQPPSAHASEGVVIVTVTVFAADQPQRAGEIKVGMSIADTDHLVVQLRRANGEAKKSQM